MAFESLCRRSLQVIKLELSSFSKRSPTRGTLTLHTCTGDLCPGSGPHRRSATDATLASMPINLPVTMEFHMDTSSFKPLIKRRSGCKTTQLHPYVRGCTTPRTRGSPIRDPNRGNSRGRGFFETVAPMAQARRRQRPNSCPSTSAANEPKLHPQEGRGRLGPGEVAPPAGIPRGWRPGEALSAAQRRRRHL
jgi:hypothetical protein